MGTPPSAPPPEGAPVVVSATDFMWFVDLALDQMVQILRVLGDEQANRRPDAEGANSPFAILTHCLGVMEYWGGATVADRPVERDRDAEFRAEGNVEELIARVAVARRTLEVDTGELDSMAAPSNVVRSDDEDPPYKHSKGAVLLHILEELFQHVGQMELTRDVLQSGDRP